jgi:alkanesulfonate monooxygenase SsuD/methylene tetrahydromethanopterin reductase-like flavin-dependent oxidoreductase (luciferase family)
MEIYRSRFRPSAQCAEPHAMAGINVILSETDEEARYLFTSLQMRFADMVRGARGLMKPPIEDIETYWQPHEKIQAQRMLACTFVGTPASVKPQLENFIARTGANEVMVATAIYDHAKRLRSYELLAAFTHPGQ